MIEAMLAGVGTEEVTGALVITHDRRFRTVEPGAANWIDDCILWCHWFTPAGRRQPEHPLPYRRRDSARQGRPELPFRPIHQSRQ